MPLEDILGLLKSEIRRNRVIFACLAAFLLFALVDAAIISPNFKIQHKIDANNFLSPWDTHPAPPACIAKGIVKIKEVPNASKQAKKGTKTIQNTGGIQLSIKMGFGAKPQTKSPST